MTLGHTDCLSPTWYSNLPVFTFICTDFLFEPSYRQQLFLEHRHRNKTQLGGSDGGPTGTTADCDDDVEGGDGADEDGGHAAADDVGDNDDAMAVTTMPSAPLGREVINERDARDLMDALMKGL